MKIDEWEIWHTYSTYIQTSNIDLDFAARRLVETGIFELAMLRDGQAYWKTNFGVGSGNTDIRLDSFGSTASIKFNKDEPTDSDPTDFAWQAWHQAAHFRFNEMRVFGEESALPHPYLRGFLGLFNFVFASEAEDLEKILCYPILTIYETGIILLEFRTISPESQVDVKDFISGAVNFFRHSFEFVEVPPGVSRYAARAYHHTHRKWNFLERISLLLLERTHDKAIVGLTKSYDAGDFTFNLSPLSSSEGDENQEQLKTVALSVFHTVTFIIANPRSGLGFLLFGQHFIPEVASYWTGRPHIHLTKFEGQCETAKENEEAHGAIWGSILARIYIPDQNQAIQYLPKDKREFQDYSVYINLSASLWVWSKNGLLQQEPQADINRGHLVYEPQVIGELLEYGNMLHYSLLDRISEYCEPGEVLSARSSLLKLEHDMLTASHFVEIRRLLTHGWKEMGIGTLKEQIKSALLIREAETRLRETRITQKVGLGLTIIFGFGTIPSLSSQVLAPLWKLLGLPLIADKAAFQTILNSLSLSLVALVLAGVLKLIENYHPNR